MDNEIRRVKKPEHILSYFKLEQSTLLVIAISGCIYNMGMTAGPWFEGRLAQALFDILEEKQGFENMVRLAAVYVAVIFLVQAMRYVKRLYVRSFANHVNRDMKHVLYQCLVSKTKAEMASEQVGAVMTKAISDVDTCVEGMRKFTTEIFDTGVVMAAYLVMLLLYDWRLTLLSMIFPPAAYFLAEKLKKPVTASTAAYKESAGRLNDATLDRVSHAVTYRVYGQEKNRDLAYEKDLTDYEKKSVRSNIWESAMQPVYRIISMLGAVMILWFGGKNVLGNGWTSWDIAAFITFLSCFMKLAAKSSKAAKLFNAVQKAKVSWARIKPFMKETELPKEKEPKASGLLEAKKLSFSYPGGKELFRDVTFRAASGEIIGVTGPVASGKSTFGTLFLGEFSYEGELLFNGTAWKELVKEEAVVGYLGHQPELLGGTIEENILLGDPGSAFYWLHVVRMDHEVEQIPEQEKTKIGNGGVRLSGGQQARIALARTLFHKRPVLILDDPFSAVDQKTELEIMKKLKEETRDCIVFLISHRLTLFPEMDQVFWVENQKIIVSNHECLMKENREYARLYQLQLEEGGCHEA